MKLQLPDMRFRSSKGFIAFVVTYAIFTDQFIFTSIIPIAPDMLQEQFDIQPGDVARKSSLILSACGVAMLVASPILGWWSDRSTSRRPLFLVGLVMLAGSTILLWRAPVIALAYIARVFQGIGSAIVWVMSLAIMFDTVGHARIGEFMGYVGIGMNLGTILGPKFGGMVFDRWGLNGVFTVCLSLIAGDVVLRVLMKEKRLSRRHSSIAIAASHDTDTDTTSTTSTIIPAATTASSSEKPNSKLAKAITQARRLPSIITLLYRPRFLCTLWGLFIMAAIGDAFKIALPIHGKHVFSWSATRIADTYIVLATPAFLGPLFGRAADRIGPRYVAVGGLVCLGACIILLRTVLAAEDESIFWLLLACIGLGTTVALEPLTAEIAHVVAKEDASRPFEPKFRNGSYGQGYGLFNTAWSAGNTLGPLWAGYMYERHGWKALWLVLGLVTLGTALPVFLLCGGWWFHRRRKVA
ncbi:hypothetical protein Q7P37_003433 [Cladosporium fusiforme]